MERTKAPSRYPLRTAAIIVLALLLVMYIPLRVRMEREKHAREKPVPGSSLSIFVTNRLGGYREPCG
jgi:hypothetical protein